MTETELPLRAARHEDWDAIARLLADSYHNPAPDEMREQFRPLFEPDRAMLIMDGDTVLGHLSARTRDLTVPGAVVPASHFTLAAVAPTHRRRGLLTRMFQGLLRNTNAGHEPLAIMWPSEGRIYPGTAAA